MIDNKEVVGLILAAGHSSRFNFLNHTSKKYLLKLNNSNILTYIIAGMVRAGIKKICIIASKISTKSRYKQIIKNSVVQLGIVSKDFELEIIRNRNTERENGYSLFLGLNAISSKYILLSMADHIFSKNVFSQLLKNYNRSDVLLATDPMQGKGFYDLDDATKVHGINSFIQDIGKNLNNYNRLDMGAFILNTKEIKTICQEIESNFYNFGVSNMVILAIKSGLKVSYLDCPDVIWLDVDNYPKYYQLKELFNYSSNLQPFGLNSSSYATLFKKEKNL